MKILCQLSAVSWDGHEIVDPNDLLDLIRGKFDDAIGYGWYRICGEAFDPKKDVLWGKDSPNQVLEIADTWNFFIQHNFLNNVDRLLHITRNGGFPQTKDVPMDNQETYAVLNAARELDNNWWGNASRSVLSEGDSDFAAFTTLLSEEKLSDVRTHPEDWAVVTVAIQM